MRSTEEFDVLKKNMLKNCFSLTSFTCQFVARQVTVRSAYRSAFFLSTIATVAAVGLTMHPLASAGPAQTHEQAPAFYRVMVGDFEITAISDGTIEVPLDKLLQGESVAKIDAMMKSGFEALPAETSINAFVINTGSKLMIVDTGAGDLFKPGGGGRLFENLKAAGYNADQFDAVLLTHVHADHSGGLVVGGKMMFPNADVYVQKADREYWFDRAKEAKAPEDQKHSFEQGRGSLTPYLDAGKVKIVDGASQLFPGITTEPAPGHTPGHNFISVESKGAKILFWGDTIHAEPVQFQKPSVTIKFDADQKAAALQREKILSDAAKKGYLIGAAHIAFPGMGHVRAQGGAYQWVPVNYSLKLHTD
ncbi:MULTISPECIES: MBL fold metallo-hydrolase [unclassified Variovorax]|uniref:MBL fold metallo-hydrolase n=1 Tax=unclassified Variovorax TaxID=663243 RepID=UPI003F48EFA8